MTHSGIMSERIGGLGIMRIVRKRSELDFDALMAVYIEGNRENGAEKYPDLSESEQLRRAEMDFYDYLQDFFREKYAFYAILENEEKAVCALRCEPFRDGFLVEALETKPDCRRRGFAVRLLREVASFLADRPLYSHVSKHNTASLRAHESAGFKVLCDYAVYVDGTVSQRAVTMCRMP